MTKTRVTVCIPHLMREDLLIKCLKSLEKNAGLPYRVIIINDGKRPLSFKSNKIQVLNNPERKGLGAARQQFAELVETEFLFALDNDVVVWPGSLRVQIEALDKNPRLGVVSGLCFQKGTFCSEIAKFDFVKNKVIKRVYSFDEILSSDGDLFEADFVPISHTTFRMKAVKDIIFDPNYKIGYEHWDVFMQLYYTNWKCAVHKKSWFGHIHYKSPKSYLKERYKISSLEASRKYFAEKWGYQPVQPFELVRTRRKSAILKVLRQIVKLQKRFLKSSGILA